MNIFKDLCDKVKNEIRKMVNMLFNEVNYGMGGKSWTVKA